MFLNPHASVSPFFKRSGENGAYLRRWLGELTCAPFPTLDSIRGSVSTTAALAHGESILERRMPGVYEEQQGDPWNFS